MPPPPGQHPASRRAWWSRRTGQVDRHAAALDRRLDHDFGRFGRQFRNGRGIHLDQGACESSSAHRCRFDAFQSRKRGQEHPDFVRLPPDQVPLLEQAELSNRAGVRLRDDPGHLAINRDQLVGMSLHLFVGRVGPAVVFLLHGAELALQVEQDRISARRAKAGLYRASDVIIASVHRAFQSWCSISRCERANAHTGIFMSASLDTCLWPPCDGVITAIVILQLADVDCRTGRPGQERQAAGPAMPHPSG
jgi:hypothetical protein